MDNDFFKFHPDLRRTKVTVVSYPIKTKDGWGTLECKSEAITGWGFSEREVSYGQN